ncbi:MAG: hypothetical protein HYY86_01830 [Candidatus Harrisonbacteria bacterium]|nr:hypothetical protein [Candidatus Harrisonbacteria bacterium]
MEWGQLVLVTIRVLSGISLVSFSLFMIYEMLPDWERCRNLLPEKPEYSKDINYIRRLNAELLWKNECLSSLGNYLFISLPLTCFGLTLITEKDFLSIIGVFSFLLFLSYLAISTVISWIQKTIKKGGVKCTSQ